MDEHTSRTTNHRGSGFSISMNKRMPFLALSLATILLLATGCPPPGSGVDAIPSSSPSGSPQFSLRYYAAIHGNITGSANQIVDAGSDGLTVTAVPDSGYQFVCWKPDNLKAASRNETAVSANMSFTAYFAPDLTQYTLAYSADPPADGFITGVSPQTISAGMDGTAVTAAANPGYRFFRWSDGVISPTRTDLCVISNLNLQARFVHDTSIVLGGTASITTASGATVDPPPSWNIDIFDGNGNPIGSSDTFQSNQWWKEILSPPSNFPLYFFAYDSSYASTAFSTYPSATTLLTASSDVLDINLHFATTLVMISGSITGSPAVPDSIFFATDPSSLTAMANSTILSTPRISDSGWTIFAQQSYLGGSAYYIVQYGTDYYAASASSLLPSQDASGIVLEYGNFTLILGP
jgi:hypothetical protein